MSTATMSRRNRSGAKQSTAEQEAREEARRALQESMNRRQ